VLYVLRREYQAISASIALFKEGQ